MNYISKQSQEILTNKFLDFNIPTRAEKAVYAVCGIPAAGKTTFVHQSIEGDYFPKKAFTLNPDHVMKATPEYVRDYNDLGAEHSFKKWEMPCRKLAYDMLEMAQDFESDIIIDMGCVRQEDLQNILNLKKNGYAIHMHYIYCPSDIAINRLKLRERYTAPDMILMREKSLNELLPKYESLSDTFQTFDNSNLETPFIKLDRHFLLQHRA